MSSVDTHVEGKVLGADDVGIELDFETSVAYPCRVGEKGGLAVRCKRRNALVEKGVDCYVVVEVNGTRDAALEYAEIDTEVKLVNVFPGKVGTYKTVVLDCGSRRNTGTV